MPLPSDHQRKANQKSHFPRPAPAFTIKPLPPITAASRRKILAERDAWLRQTDSACLFHRLFDAIPGLQFFAKNSQGKMMFVSQGNRDKFHTTDETAMIGLTDFDLNPPSLAQSYTDDDARIYATGQPLLNHVELGFDEQAMPDWFVVNKMPIRSRTGKIIGIMGFSQAYQQRAELLSPFQSISKAVSHVRQNYQQDISMADLIPLVGLSGRQLERKFKACFGIGPQQFVIKTRLLAACRRLTASDDGLARIAYDCGFADQSAFAHQFRRHLGMAPHEFRHSPPLSARMQLAAATTGAADHRPEFVSGPPPITAARQRRILAERDAWLRKADSSCSFHRLFDVIPGLQFFAKNRQGKMMFVSQGNRDKFHTTDETAMIGLTDFDLSPPSLAQSYIDDDARIYATGQPLLNHVELGFDEQAMPDWFVVNKMPIRSRTGKIIGIMGFSQAYQQRAELLSPFQSISKAVSHVRQNYQQDISMADLIPLVGLSGRQLERKFKACFGIGPQQFVIKTRLLAACRRLTASDDGLARIAYGCGFTHPSAFAHQFRRHFGMTPRVFRRLRLAR
jgi:transcriptional regulator GlxA family with amidase domain